MSDRCLCQLRRMTQYITHTFMYKDKKKAISLKVANNVVVVERESSHISIMCVLSQQRLILPEREMWKHFRCIHPKNGEKKKLDSHLKLIMSTFRLISVSSADQQKFLIQFGDDSNVVSTFILERIKIERISYWCSSFIIQDFSTRMRKQVYSFISSWWVVLPFFNHSLTGDGSH